MWCVGKQAAGNVNQCPEEVPVRAKGAGEPDLYPARRNGSVPVS
jgi:hypothetical protein